MQRCAHCAVSHTSRSRQQLAIPTPSTTSGLGRMVSGLAYGTPIAPTTTTTRSRQKMKARFPMQNYEPPRISKEIPAPDPGPGEVPPLKDPVPPPPPQEVPFVPEGPGPAAPPEVPKPNDPPEPTPPQAG